MSNDKTKADKKLKLISKISEIADGMTLKYLETLNKTINDNDLTPKDGIKAFCEMDKVLRISKLFSDRVLLAEGKATENVGVGGMPFNVTFTKTYEGLPPETDDAAGDRCESDE